ncbi:hypothetical protein NPIL_443141 [Nephila pilipes]|uniref:MATH domain-containing protein n=1 Tax=Nephila pilipes TaxID=299642 RepID=A0A8X6NMR8_NEPPI|nr:hypothetical protein NPIL_443141 [Nephila pilipes]
MENLERGRSEYTLVWIIENVGHAWQTLGEKLVSPKFITHLQENSTWTLELYPRGVSNEEYISCFFIINSADKVPNCDVDFEIIITPNGGSSRARSASIPFTARRGGFPCFMKRSEILFGNQFLNPNSLTLQCRIKLKSHIHDVCFGESFVKTHILVKRISHSCYFASDTAYKSICIRQLSESRPFMIIRIQRNHPNEFEIHLNPNDVGSNARYFTLELGLADEVTGDKFWNRRYRGWSPLPQQSIFVPVPWINQSSENTVTPVRRRLIKFDCEVAYSTGEDHAENERVVVTHRCDIETRV